MTFDTPLAGHRQDDILTMAVLHDTAVAKACKADDTSWPPHMMKSYEHRAKQPLQDLDTASGSPTPWLWLIAEIVGINCR